MIVLGRLMLLSGAAVLAWVFLQIGGFLSTAAVHPDALPEWGWVLIPIPSGESVDNGFFYFNAIVGSLAWLVEIGLAVLLIITGRRMISAERGLRAEDQRAIEQIKRSQQARGK